MFKSLGFVSKVVLIASCAAILVRLWELAPERRAEQLRAIGIGTLRNIEDWAEWGQESLREEVPPPSDEAADEAPSPAGGRPAVRRETSRRTFAHNCAPSWNR
ncbi:MAG TPA: hypothetical protein PLF81_25395 [Candidatus Anammoximicrobium sp.]|nr:hypothetical protein [Candidatus Anammoximicrobium sp.]